MQTVKIKIYAPDIEPRFRHATIFEAYESLNSGETMALTNDHDPRPLYFHIMVELEGEFTWEYVKQGPDVWQVMIGKV